MAASPKRDRESGSALDLNGPAKRVEIASTSLPNQPTHRAGGEQTSQGINAPLGDASGAFRNSPTNYLQQNQRAVSLAARPIEQQNIPRPGWQALHRCVALEAVGIHRKIGDLFAGQQVGRSIDAGWNCIAVVGERAPCLLSLGGEVHDYQNRFVVLRFRTGSEGLKVKMWLFPGLSILTALGILGVLVQM